MENKNYKTAIREYDGFIHNLKQMLWTNIIKMDRLYIVKQDKYSELEKYGMLKLIIEQCKINWDYDYEIYILNAKYDNYRISINNDYSWDNNIIKEIRQLNYNLTINECSVLKDEYNKQNTGYLDNKSDIIAIKINKINRNKKSKLWRLLHKNNMKIYDFTGEYSLSISHYKY